ncbi:MAG: 3-phosphoglycerate dehydrogenase [Deltaproteobacteria bacterium]|nr:3-phosphoglycerate dehydrogenase [Deltaproteobacteria bacterium]
MKALITASFHPDGLARLRRLMEVVHEDWRANQHIYFDGSEFAAVIRRHQADVLIVEADLVHEEVLDTCELKLIGSCRGDPLNVGLVRATAKKIPVLFAPGRNADAVADLTVANMLCLARHLYTVNLLLKTGQMHFASTKDYLSVYGRYGGFELGGVTAGIVGFGAIGRAVARRLQGFGTTLLAYDPYLAPERMRALGVTPVELDDLMAQADIVTIHCPEVPETVGLISRARIERMKPGALFLNLARAAIVDDDALYEAASSGRLGGVAIDVFRDEPVQPDNRFVQLPNCLVTPHLGGATRDVVRHQTEMIVAGIERWLRGERPQHIANPEVLG